MTNNFIYLVALTRYHIQSIYKQYNILSIMVEAAESGITVPEDSEPFFCFKHCVFFLHSDIEKTGKGHTLQSILCKY